MAFTAQNLIDLEAALIAIQTTEKDIVSVTIEGKTINWGKRDGDKMLKLIHLIRYELGLAAGTYSPRVYAKQGGRGQ